jgi:hypothetical protein
MAEEKKRLTAAELRSQQEEREGAVREAQAKATEEARKRNEERQQAELRAQVEKIKATWYDNVTAAAERPGIRFVVLARVVFDGRRPDFIEEISKTIDAEGYKCEVANLEPAPAVRQQRGPVSPVDETEGEVVWGNVRGWKPASLPRFGANGTLRFLIVKW